MTAAQRLLALPLTWLGALAFLPLGLVLLISFATPGAPIAFEPSVGAWVRLVDPAWLAVLGRSVAMAAATTSLCLVLGVPLAVFVARRPARVRHILYFAVLLPLWANSLALTYAWIVVLRTGGLADQVAQALGAIGADATLGWLYTPGAVLLGLVYAYLPFMVHAVYGSAERLDWRLIDAAEDLGATRATALRRVVLPLLRPGIAAGAVLVFVPALGAFVVPDLLGGAKSAYLGNVLQERFRMEPIDWPLGCALAVTVLLAVGGGIAFLARRERGLDALA